MNKCQRLKKLKKQTTKIILFLTYLICCNIENKIQRGSANIFLNDLHLGAEGRSK